MQVIGALGKSMLHCLQNMTFSKNTYVFFFFNDTATTEIYTLSLHDALPIFPRLVISSRRAGSGSCGELHAASMTIRARVRVDRNSTRLNSSHSQISYAVFCLKKKKNCSTFVITDGAYC